MRRVHLAILALALLGCSSFVFQGCAVNPVTGKKELHLVSVSEEEEINLGKKSFVPLVSNMGGFYRDKDLEEYIQEVGIRLAKKSHRPNLPYTFRILNSSIPNAFALPGGYITVHRGLLVGISSEGELAAVLGHEIGHVTARHAVAAYQRAIAANLTLMGIGAATGGSQGTMRLSSLAANLVENGYSREQEREADYLGVDYMIRGKYDPRGAVDLQNYFYEEFEKGKGSNFFQGLFRSHPFSQERLSNIRRYLRERYPKISGSAGYSVYEERYQLETAGVRKVQKAYDVYDEGVGLLKKKKSRDALDKFRQAIDMEPGQAPFYSMAGVVFLLDDNLNSAIRYLNKSVSRDPEYVDARIYLGIALAKKGDCSQGITHLEKSMKIMATKVAAKYLGRCYRKLGDIEKARKYEAMSR